MIESNEKYSWDSEKRSDNIRDRGLDIVEMADEILLAPDTVFVPYDNHEDDEQRYTALAILGEKRFALAFTYRGDAIHLITIFARRRDKQWRRHYEKQD